MTERKHIIVAPHADDEIIGCFEILMTGKVWKVLFPILNEPAIKEVKKCSDVFGFEINVFAPTDLYKWGGRAAERGGLIFLPDPIYELHPEHKTWGGMGRQLGHNVVYYTTNMNAPYMHECNDPKGKKELLDLCYPDKSTLWRYDHKYWLFEGHTTWNVNLLL